MNPYIKTEHDVRAIVARLTAEGKLPDVSADKIEATPTKDAAHGEIATNAAMVIAAQAKKNPKEIAAIIINSLPIRGRVGVGALDAQAEPNNAPLLTSPLQGEEYIIKAEIAGPGFINLTLKPEIWQEQLPHIVEQGARYGDSTLGQGKKVNVEYVSANPTGPMHVGHGRGAVYGDALANLLIKAGHNVTKEYYINDAGGQIDKLTQSFYIRYREACGETIGEIPEGLYPGDYLKTTGETAAKEQPLHDLKMDYADWVTANWRKYAVDAMMKIIKEDLSVLGIHHDVFTSEQVVRDAGEVEEAVRLLDEKGLIYTGVLEPPKGKPIPEDWEPKPQTLFRSTQFGDDIDRAIKKADGSWAYITPDIAYHFDKCKRGFNLLIDVFGADHGGYVKRLKAAVSALSDGKVDLEIKLCQLVKFMRGGEPLKMSKRAGTFITVREVVDEVGKDVFRFIMLTRKNDVPLDFDFEKVMEQSKDNPVFYVQYAHARACSVMRKIAEEVPEAMKIQEKAGVFAKLKHPAEMALIRLMCAWPRTVEAAALSLEPHRVAFYLHDLAAAFHGLWTLGNDDLGLRFIVKDDIELTSARLMLAQALTKVIASGLRVLGVEPLEEMR